MSVPRKPRVLRIVAVLALLAPLAAFGQQGDPNTLSLLLQSNDGLRAQGMDYIVQQIDFYSRDGSRSSAQLFQQEFRWVPGDPRRGSSDASLSYLFDGSWGETGPGGISRDGVETAVERAVSVWSADSCLSKVSLVNGGEATGDVTVFDFVAGAGGLGDPFAADVVVAGFQPGLENVFSSNTIAFSVSFIFVDGDGNPTDIDHDGHLDTAHNEIYFNPSLDWILHGNSGFDVETTVLHELGHALGLGHFGPPPESVMNPVYDGVKRRLDPIDHSALCLLYASK